jgi:uncharacterized protein (DUF885 family)
MKKCISIFGAAILCLAIHSGAAAKGKTVSGENARFDAFKDRLVLKMWKVYPAWAGSVGYHKYDSVLIVPTAESREMENRFCSSMIDSLGGFVKASLSATEQTDYDLIHNQLEYGIWGNDVLKAWQWDPSTYNVCGYFSDMLANKYAPLSTRLHNFYVRMAKVPAYYEAAKQNIRNPSKEHTKLAIDQNLGGMSCFKEDLEDALKKSDLDASAKTKIRARAKACVAAIEGYADWLKNLKNDHPRSFRLGADLYAGKFKFELQSAYTPDQIYNKAVHRKAELHEDMYMLAKSLWPKYFGKLSMPADHLTAIRLMIDKLSENHVKADSFQTAIEHHLPELVKFINNKQLLYLDPSKPLVVRKEPGYMAGVAGASISSPGPYDKNGNTYYNVGSLAGWAPEKAESYLREYNHYILQILDIHEAIPGHYTQLVYANKTPSIIKSLLGSSSMIEGWAVYSERMMLENGYDGDKGVNSKQASPEMWLMYYKWHLRSVCNTILDYSVHTKNMSKAQAMDLLTREAFQQKAEAEGKWNRVSVTQVQLCCYFTGFTEIYELRNKIIGRLGGKFDLKRFHEQFLSYGSAPVKYISQLMLADPKNNVPKSKFPDVDR